MQDPNWYKAKHVDGRVGLVPYNYIQKRSEVKLNAMVWFHGKISRDDAESLLMPREVSCRSPPASLLTRAPLDVHGTQDGLFLVRESTNFPGDYTLCVCFNGKVEHYRVIYKDNKLTIDEEEYFENLSQLVQVRLLSFFDDE